MDAGKLDRYADQLAKGIHDGKYFASLVEKNEITSQERRKIVKLAAKKKADEEKRKEKANKVSGMKKRTTHQSSDTTAKSVCLACRQPGHTVKTCPNAPSQTLGICFKCGSSSHILKDCPDKSASKDLKYAQCFICKKTGHISRDCPDNNHGLYPSGGGCHICGGTDHLVRDCPNKRSHRTNETSTQPTIGTSTVESGDVEDFDTPIVSHSVPKKRPRPQSNHDRKKNFKNRKTF